MHQAFDTTHEDNRNQLRPERRPNGGLPSPDRPVVLLPGTDPTVLIGHVQFTLKQVLHMILTAQQLAAIYALMATLTADPSWAGFTQAQKREALEEALKGLPWLWEIIQAKTAEAVQAFYDGLIAPWGATTPTEEAYAVIVQNLFNNLFASLPGSGSGTGGGTP